jgi:hypothetical protein
MDKIKDLANKVTHKGSGNTAADPNAAVRHFLLLRIVDVWKLTDKQVNNSLVQELPRRKATSWTRALAELDSTQERTSVVKNRRSTPITLAQVSRKAPEE